MGGQQHDGVGGDQARLRQVDLVPCRGGLQGRALGLVLIEQGEGSAAGPAAQYDLLIAEPGLKISDAGAKIEDALLHNQGCVIPPIARVAIDDVAAGVGQGRDQGQEGSAAHRVTEQDDALALRIIRADAHALDEDLSRGAAIDLLQAAVVGMDKAIGLAHHAHWHSFPEVP